MEPSCRQCGKRTSDVCARSDCWNTKENLAVEVTRRAKEVAKANGSDGKAAVMAFNVNFEKVTEWAESIGAQRPLDRGVINRMGRETVRAAECYAAIARSLT